jgi:hypothetical protein
MASVASSMSMTKRRARLLAGWILVAGVVANVVAWGWPVIVIVLASAACGLVLMRFVGPIFVRALADWRVPFIVTIAAGLVIACGLSLLLLGVPQNVTGWLGFVGMVVVAMFAFEASPTVFYPDTHRWREKRSSRSSRARPPA